MLAALSSARQAGSSQNENSDAALFLLKKISSAALTNEFLRIH
jgi:hypothetical protein